MSVSLAIMPTDWDPWPGNTKAELFDMGAQYNHCVSGALSLRPGPGAHRDSDEDGANRSIQVCIDHGLPGILERHRAGDLLVGEFGNQEGGEDPGVEVAPPQMRQRACGHDAMQC